MSIREDLQNALKTAMKERNAARLSCLRMAKGALLLKEKAGPRDRPITDEEALQALRAEVKKRRQSMEAFEEVGKPEEVEKLREEIAIIEEFLPQQLGAEALTERVKAYVAEHPEVDQAGRLTGAMKKELGDLADGKLLNRICREVLGQA